TNGANNVGAITIASSQTGTFKNNVAATTITIGTGAANGTMVIDSAGTPAAITVRGAINGSSTGYGNLTVQNSGGTTFTGIIGGTRIGALSITQATTFQAAVSAATLSTTAAISNGTTLDISGTSSIGANITTSGTQTYTGAVTLTASPTLTTTANTITFSSTVNAADATDRDLTFGTGTGTVTFTGAVGTSFNLGTITNASGQQLTFSGDVTANTIANYGTLLFNASSAKTISPAITDNGTTTIQVINSADGAPGIITFSGNVAADTITIGTTTKAGSAKFDGTVTGTNIRIVGGDNLETSLGNFASTVTVTAITLDDNTATASATFSGTTATITGTINGLATTEGTVTVSGTGKTFASAIGATNPLTTLTISAGTTTFNSTVAATTVNANAASTFTGAVTATTFGTTAA
ncbi:MAG: hypothetical protein EBU39_04200, partial [Proteobacteria bacterium]|nr:hypothetical protein [Pseudomonadota bacterium]